LVLLLAVAIYLSPVIPMAVQMLAWAALLILTGVYQPPLILLPAHCARISKGVGIIAFPVPFMSSAPCPAVVTRCSRCPAARGG
jgi:hypothetical protein